MTVKNGKRKQRKLSGIVAKQRRPHEIIATWHETNRTWTTEQGMTNKKPSTLKMAMEALDAMTAERERLAVRLAEEQRNASDLMQVRLEAVRQGHQLEVVRLISEGKKEEAIASVLRKDVMLFGMEVRFANDKTLEKARQEWYEKGKQDAIMAFRAFVPSGNIKVEQE